MGYFSAGSASHAESSTFTATQGILLTGATINTKGAYVNVLTPTTTHAKWMYVALGSGGVINQHALVDIAYTNGGSEHVIVENLGVQTYVDATFVTAVALPCSIPAGSTIRARYQRSSASLTMRCGITLFTGNGGLQGSNRITTYGANTVDSGGTEVTPSTAGVKGIYSTLSAATTHPINWMMLQIGNQANAARTLAEFLVDVAVGADGFENILVPNLHFQITAGEAVTPSFIGPFPISVPVGSRLAVRGQSATGDATDKLFDVIAYGIS